MAKTSKTLNIVKGVIAVLLLLCLIDADYGYYQAMRTLVSFGFAFLAYQYYSEGGTKNAIIFLCLLILFQPLLKIALGREIWMVVDVAVAIYLIITLLKSYSQTKLPKETSYHHETDNPKETTPKSQLRINFPDKK